MTQRPLAVAVGDPAGVGPIVALLAAAARPSLDLVLYGPRRFLEAEARRLGLQRCPPIEDCGDVADEAVAGRRPDPACGAVQLASLEAAARSVWEGHARALVTGPVSKMAVASGPAPAFRGQTEHLAALCGLREDAVSMLFLGPRLRVGLVTTHLPVAEAARHVRPETVARTAVHLAQALERLGDAPERRIVVTGINPHAGEGGLLGTDEMERVVPGIARARAAEPFAAGRWRLDGPLGAETAMRMAADGRVAGVVAMLHDQATIASKLLDWGAAVNVTWGLPFVRTSVDHGVAYDAAASGRVDPAGMIAALDMAVRLTGG
ncbi:MAG: 4-hydroxythreonine-4-phosphate dehydrogenase PdxA [Myxococcota bacterium]|nr:4-hydroxythreonine-4-phosphate dehydrogenase PdxA [Myxococcota bacterium]MDW8362317.1 4-hydroxythreonine-4-phosphate dehydrogenase PdxA [Myxococcales bacterium]